MKKEGLEHIAIIMDGNARWAQQNNKNKATGHNKGAKAAKALIPFLHELQARYITLYAFSSENWNRPADEVQSIMNIMSRYLASQLSIMQQYNIRLKVIGDLSKISAHMRQRIEDIIDATKENSALTLCIAFSYGSRAEILHACQQMIESSVTEVSEEIFQQYLYDPEMPNVDLLIRTSGLQRISNFLLWQSAYAEMYFLPKLWPDVTIDDIKLAVQEYHTRIRSFGLRT